MRLKPSSLIRTTTFRLAVAQAIVFILFTFALLSTVYVTTAGQLTAEAEQAADQEFAVLAEIHEREPDQINAEVIQRVARGGPFLYVYAEPNGRVISGHFSQLPVMPRSGADRVRFEYETVDDAGRTVRRGARGRAGRLLDGSILLVARDMGDAALIVGRVTSAVWAGAGVGLAFSLLAGLVASRQAARRAEALSRTARDVMRGDLARRAPIWGVGDEFDALAEDINAMLSRLERLVQSSRTAGDAIAHDLRTPLSRMRQRLEAALEQPPGGSADREALEKAVAECDQLLATFNAILRLAKVQSLEGWTFHPVDLTAVIEDLAELYGPAAEEAGVTFEAHLGPKLIVQGDRSLLTQAFANLLDNAVKYTPGGGRIIVRAGRLADGRVEASVSDTGPGIPEAERERVKERFFRLESARTTPGAGLGLSLVSAVAELHKGELRLTEGEGGAAGPGLRVALALQAA